MPRLDKSAKGFGDVGIVVAIVVIAIVAIGIAVAGHYVKKHYAPQRAASAASTTNGIIAKNVASAVGTYVNKYSTLPTSVEHNTDPSSISLCGDSCTASSVTVPSSSYSSYSLAILNYTTNPNIYKNTFTIIENAICNSNETGIGQHVTSNKAAILYTIPSGSYNYVECLES